MGNITAIFSDVGGVLATNGWDRASRRRATEQFQLDWEEFEDRHELLATAFDTGQITLDEYLGRTVFYRPRGFTPQAFKDFMYAQSEPYPDSLALVGQLAQSGKYFLATLNNESTEINLYRIQRFGLRHYFSVFFSSCFVGIQKPDPAIYQLALKLTQRDPIECLFIDDRALNLESAASCGMRTLQFRGAAQLKSDLTALGVTW